MHRLAGSARPRHRVRAGRDAAGHPGDGEGHRRRHHLRSRGGVRDHDGRAPCQRLRPDHDVRARDPARVDRRRGREPCGERRRQDHHPPIRDGLRFHSGNPVRPEDVEFSLERAVLLDRSPAFILTQFGWNADNAGESIEVVDDRHVRITIAEGFSPGLVLNALSAGVGSVIDRELVLAHEGDGDLGTGWLQTNSAGSGPFRLATGQRVRGPRRESRLPPRRARRAARSPAPRASRGRSCSCCRQARSTWRATSRPT